MGGHILRKHARIGVRIVAADNNDGSNAVLLANLCGNGKLLFGLQLGSSGTDDIKSAGISVLINISILKHNIIVLNQSAGASLEANQDILFIGCLQGIVQTAYDIVSARCLSAGKNHADYLLLSGRSILSLLKGNLGFPVGVREQLFNFLLICCTGGSASLLDSNLGDSMSEHCRELRNILISCFLKW